jgi:hypothetical protein
MRVDGPSYHIEQARWHHRPGTAGAGKAQIGQIASWQAGRNRETPLNHIADLGHAANAPGHHPARVMSDRAGGCNVRCERPVWPTR